jgi:hypothetical protein
MTGGIRTKFFQNLEDQKLTPGSLYAPAKEEIEPIIGGALMPNSMDADVYAEAVVKNALKSNPQKNH